MKKLRFVAALAALLLGACTGSFESHQKGFTQAKITLIDGNSDGVYDGIDINEDGVADFGFGVDDNHDGCVEALVDTNHNSKPDSLDVNCDGHADFTFGDLDLGGGGGGGGGAR